MTHLINWFELPCTDLARATTFYETILAARFKTMDFQGTPTTLLKKDGLGGALVEVKDRAPSTHGARVFLNVEGALDAVLGRVAQAGGRQVGPVVNLGPQGKYAIVVDTEGNHVGLHQLA